MSNQTFPLSFAQQRLWFLEQLDAEAASYNLLRAFRIEGPLDIPALTQALQAITDRHESLRTTFVTRSGEPSQAVQLTVTVELPLTDLSHLPELQGMKESARLAGEEARKVFDLATAPLFRLRLIRLGPDVHVLILVMHHIITDGWSMSVFFREIAAIYRHVAHAEPLELCE